MTLKGYKMVFLPHHSFPCNSPLTQLSHLNLSGTLQLIVSSENPGSPRKPHSCTPLPDSLWLFVLNSKRRRRYSRLPRLPWLSGGCVGTCVWYMVIPKCSDVINMKCEWFSVWDLETKPPLHFHSASLWNTWKQRMQFNKRELKPPWSSMLSFTCIRHLLKCESTADPT